MSSAQPRRFRDVWRQQYDEVRESPSARFPKGARGVAQFVAAGLLVLTITACRTWSAAIGIALAVLTAIALGVYLMLQVRYTREWNKEHRP
jgi:O-antigen ligase